MPHLSARRIGLAVVGVAAFGSFCAASAAPARGPAFVSTAVAHYPGGVVAKVKHRPRIELYKTGFTGAGEPTIGVAKDGAIYADVMTKVVRSTDRGRSWRDVSPGHATSLDPYLYVDKTTQRVFKSDLLGTCQALSWSDDRGESWTTAPAACNQSDHQTIYAGKPTLSPLTSGYPNILYNCSQTVGYNGFSTASGCAKSLDGGTSWTPTGTFAFNDPSPYGAAADSGDSGIPAHCIGDIGPIFVGTDGTLYVSRGWCGQPWLAASTDEGLTWTRTQVAKNGMSTTVDGGFGLVAPGSGQSDHEAAVVADRNGNVFVMWVALNRLPYIAVSRDHGKTWGPPLMVGAPGVNEAWGPALDIDDRGAVAFTYIGTRNSPGKPWTKSYSDTTWSGYLGRIDKPLTARPLIFSGPVSPLSTYPLVQGACGPDRCNEGVLDFVDVIFGPDHTMWGAFVDTANAS
ncbi:MAG: glycoside hydrolase, partial [Frankia sp.]|nr:glycoside hydrolase [Frankia sp.]